MAILRYIESCETSGIEASDHFREVAKTITAGKGAQRSVKDYMFTRYACYLIAQNSDPKKEEIALHKATLPFRLESRNRLKNAFLRILQLPIGKFCGFGHPDSAIAL